MTNLCNERFFSISVQLKLSLLLNLSTEWPLISGRGSTIILSKIPNFSLLGCKELFANFNLNQLKVLWSVMFMVP